MPTDIISLIAQHGGTLGLAIFAIWMLNRVWQDRVEAEKQHAERLRLMYDAIILALNRNTEILSTLSAQMNQRAENDQRIAELLVELNK